MKENPSRTSGERGLLALFNASAKAQIAFPAFRIAIVVGSILNVINQGARLFDGDQINWFQVVLNFVVPYCVASYSAAHNELRNR